MTLRRFWLALGACALLSVPAARPAHAQNAGVSFDGPWFDWSTVGFNVGYEFNVLSPIMIRALGVFDDASSWIDPNDAFSGPNGLLEDHEVGIWDTFGTLLGSATVGAGTGGTVHNYFRFVSVTPFALAIGTYRIASTTGRGLDKITSTDWAVNWVTDPSIELVQARYVESGSLADPTEVDPSLYGYLGPNMMFSAVPEPATMVLLASGLAGLSVAGLIRRRRETLES